MGLAFGSFAQQLGLKGCFFCELNRYMVENTCNNRMASTKWFAYVCFKMGLTSQDSTTS